MREYSKEFKDSIIARMLPPNNEGVPQLARETGVPKDTLYSWRLKHRNASADALARQEASGDLSSEEKFAVVIETASLNEVELSEYCRRKGFYPEQVQAWRKACMQANAPATPQIDQTQARVQAKQVKQLEHCQTGEPSPTPSSCNPYRTASIIWRGLKSSLNRAEGQSPTQAPHW